MILVPVVILIIISLVVVLVCVLRSRRRKSDGSMATMSKSPLIMTPSYILLFQVPITSPKSKTPSPSPRRITVHLTLRKRQTCQSSTFISPPPSNRPPSPRRHPCHSSLSLRPPPHRQKISTRHRAKKSHAVTPVLARRRRRAKPSVRHHNTNRDAGPVTNISNGVNSGMSRQRRSTIHRPNQTRRARTRRMVSEPVYPLPLTLATTFFLGHFAFFSQM